MRFFPSRRALALASLSWAVSCGSGAASGPALRPVAIDAMQFSPQTIAVRVGDTVEWSNKDPFPHTVTADNAGFDSGEIPAAGSWKWTARKTGVFPYRCALHPTMRGTLVVK